MTKRILKTLIIVASCFLAVSIMTSWKKAHLSETTSLIKEKSNLTIIKSNFKEEKVKTVLLLSEYNGTIYRRMKKDDNGNFINSPLTGAPNSSQKGARTKASNSKYNDFSEVDEPSDMVGPSHTGKKGLSASTVDGNNGGSVHTRNLPKGLGAENDSGNHISIYPTTNMTFSKYQKLLNSIPWK